MKMTKTPAKKVRDENSGVYSKAIAIGKRVSILTFTLAR